MLMCGKNEKENIKKLLLANGPGLFAKYKVNLAYLFGSASSGRFGPRSDIDIAVRFEHAPEPNDYFRSSTLLEVRLARLLGGKG